MTGANRELNWLLLLIKVDGLNRKVKEPGWTDEDKNEVYAFKDGLMSLLMQNSPEEVTLKLSLIPYYSYSPASKDRAGALMRSDPDRKPFEYYLGQISPGPGDIEIPEKATVEFFVTCAGQDFSFHQPISWFIAHGGDVSALEKKPWFGGSSYHHMYLEKVRGEIKDLQGELNITLD